MHVPVVPCWYFRVSTHVHKLYNFLLNLNARESVVRVGDREKKSRADVPTLLASRPFLNASSCRLRVDVGGKGRFFLFIR